jgi:hypothetical protein
MRPVRGLKKEVNEQNEICYVANQLDGMANPGKNN